MLPILHLRALALALFPVFAPLSMDAATICFAPHCETRDGPRTWTYELGVAWITNNNIEDFTGVFDSIQKATGPGGGEIFNITASRRLGELKWNVFGQTFTPQLELPLSLEIVNENHNDPFLDVNASFNVRWIDFPWNECVKTSFAIGIGLSYSGQIYEIDQLRHPGDERSRLKFNWPIQLTLAHPRFPQHQVMVYILHQSGGHVFDEGGVNSIGFGYRHGF